MVSGGQVARACICVYVCVCVVCMPSRVNTSGLPSPIPGPTYTAPGIKHQVSWLKQGNEDTPERWLLGTEMAVRDAFGHCEELPPQNKTHKDYNKDEFTVTSLVVLMLTNSRAGVLAIRRGHTHHACSLTPRAQITSR